MSALPQTPRGRRRSRLKWAVLLAMGLILVASGTAAGVLIERSYDRPEIDTQKIGQPVEDRPADGADGFKHVDPEFGREPCSNWRDWFSISCW